MTETIGSMINHLTKFKDEHGVDTPVIVATERSEYEFDIASSEVVDGTLVLETDLA